MTVKNIICGICAAIGGYISYLLGGFTADLVTLILFMVIDFLMGLALALIFHRSSKTETGTLSSSAAFKGIIKKIAELMFVVIAQRLDIYLGCAFIKDAVIIGFIINELISITENAGLMGITSPAIVEAIDILKKQVGGKNENNR
ncbi:MAG: phage holin family protein [Clostridia bacterium]|nr:phage holin family protein [Clostridia bacterium]